MLVLGANLGYTNNGRALRDGGACLIRDDGKIVAVAEERVSRVKHDGGFAGALNYCLGEMNANLDEIDLGVVTSCCEAIRHPATISEFGDAAFPLSVRSHHDAHAYSAFWPSRFDEAIIVVVDGGGNTLAPGGSKDWWSVPREQASYYVGYGNKIELLERDFDRPYEAGFGEVYRAFTHYLGWPSSTFAGNTMALAALGQGRLLGKLLFHMENGRLILPIAVDPQNPIAFASRLLGSVGAYIAPHRKPEEKISQEHSDIAELLQTSLYFALRSRIERLVSRTGVRNVCFAGGVALNCIAIGRLLHDGVVEKIFVQPAAGDTGQCLGAAYMASDLLGGSRPRVESPELFLGRQYGRVDIIEALSEIDRSAAKCDIAEIGGDAEIVAQDLDQGSVVAWFSGRSELGPRALGGRSILGDPRSTEVRDRMRAIKGREPFLPFAPSVLASAADTYFSSTGSESMTVAVWAQEGAKKVLPAVFHEDNSARVQSVNSLTPFRALLEEFEQVSGFPVLINTSLNLRGEPIAEAPRDAVSVFLRSDIDCLFMDGFYVRKWGV